MTGNNAKTVNHFGKKTLNKANSANAKSRAADQQRLINIKIMNKLLAFSYLIVILCIHVILPKNAWGFEIDIVGSPEYKQQVAQALILLSKKSPEAYQIAKKYIGKIEQGERSAMFAYKNPPTYQMSNKTAFHSLTWCASTIAHDSYHSKLYHDYKEINGEPVPYEIWADFEAEKKCISHQIKTLKKIEAPISEINYCISLDGTHGDVNKDGKLDSIDYELRNW